jgi:predicted NAD-dependent protein-ADP-ribosyltransferase YbiA (DUF1768 family)
MLGRHFNSIDQYFAWQKARYFGDADMAAQMLLNKNPVKIRRLSFRIRGFKLEAWKTVRDNVSKFLLHAKIKNHIKIMYIGLWAKFTQNTQLFKQLLATGDAMIAEADVKSQHWANGIDASNIECLQEPDLWPGDNRLGSLLMELRDDVCHSIF